jgi:heat-inducible transcriptional repressor
MNTDNNGRAEPSALAAMNARSREIFRHIVDAYVTTGAPVGSRTLSRRLGMNLSPATVRNVMADLEELGLLYAPHTSAGRLPTQQGLRLFVDGLLEYGNLDPQDREHIETRCAATGRSLPQAFEEAGSSPICRAVPAWSWRPNSRRRSSTSSSSPSARAARSW